MKFPHCFLFIPLILPLFGGAPSALAQSDVFNQGKLLATGGVSQVEGAGGAGLTPWALITGYGTDKGMGINAHHTYVKTGDFSLNGSGIAIGIYDRFEISYTHHWFNTHDAGTRLGIGKGYTFEQDVIGAKWRVAGDAIYSQNDWMPQIAIGGNYKKNKNGALVSALGANSDEGVDFYATASKLFLNNGLLMTAGARLTKANQFGLLGFGNPTNTYSLQGEFSIALLLRKDFAIGADYRMKPNNLAFAKEENAFALFAAYFINKNVSITAAYTDLGEIALQGSQNGLYLSLQIGY